MALVILPISDAMICETWLPHRAALLHPEGESSFDELHGSLQRNLLRGREQHVDVVGHDHEFMKQEFSSVAIMRKRVNHEACVCLPSKDWKALGGDGCDEEDTVGVHPDIVARVEESCR